MNKINSDVLDEAIDIAAVCFECASQPQAKKRAIRKIKTFWMATDTLTDSELLALYVAIVCYVSSDESER